jgi:hypothetical protein
MASSSKKRQTFAKMTRERAVREKRELKREKKQAAAEARRLGITPEDSAALPVGEDVSADESSPVAGPADEPSPAPAEDPASS